jgi:hypothetical protein
MRADSSLFEQFTLGIEEEFQIVDPNTRELRSHVSEILEEGRMLLGEQVKPEMIQSMIEVGTGICMDINEARTDITNLRSVLSTLVRKKGLESFKIYLHAQTHGCIATDQRIESVGLFLASFVGTKGIEGTPGTVDEKGKPWKSSCGIIAVR